MNIVKKLREVVLGERYIALEKANKELLWQLRLNKVEQLQQSAEPPKEKKLTIPVLGFDSMDGEPTDTNDRRGYVERVDEFYTDILQGKLKDSIGQVRELYGSALMEGNLGIPRSEYDWFVRGIEAGLFKINEWCVTLQAERNSVLQDKENEE